MDIIISLLAIYGLSFFIKEKDGPLNIMTKLRSFLMSNATVQVFFYKLFDCYFCVGTYAGITVYLVRSHFQGIDLYGITLWGFAGAAISMLINRWTEHE